MKENLRSSMKRIAFFLSIVLVFSIVSRQVEAYEEMASEPDSQVDELAQIMPPPRLSDREIGVHIEACEPTQSPGVDAVEGEDYYCGVLTVPQNWDEPDGRNLDLAFVVVNATEKQSASEALIFLSGGPGQNAIGKPIHSYQHLQTDRDIIRLDQRGTGFSQRLGWEECLVLALQNDAPPAQVEALQAAAYNPLEEGSTPLKLNELDIPALNETCWDQFVEQGLDLNQFTTAASARDVVELLKALNYDSFNLHGVSYGTRLAMAIMAELPTYDDAPALRSVVLDSTFPPSIYLIASLPRNDHDFMLQLLAECQADAACRQAYPSLGIRLATLLNRLEEEPLTANGETVTLADVVLQLSTVGASQAGYLPKMIAELEVGVLDTYLALRDGLAGADFPEDYPGDLDRSDPVQAFIADAYDAAGGGVPGLETIVYLNFALVDADPLAALQAFVEEALSGDAADQLSAKLAALNADEIAASPYVAQFQADFAAEAGMGDLEDLARLELAKQRQFVAARIAQPLFNTIHCAEDIQFERFEDAVNSFNDLAFPQLSNLDTARTQADLCQNWPMNAAPIDVKNPVSSTVPALILQGAYDMRTPVYMGKRASRELANSTYILVPQQGHEVWTNAADCVGGIATAFIQDPDATLDLSCLDARQPSWALPDDAATGQITPEQMNNATYSGIYDEPVTLADGVYEGEPFVEGGASRPVVTYIDNTLVHGDLDGDGAEDAAVLLIENSGGSGSFYYVGAQLNRNGQPADAGAALLGDRVQLISMTIADGQVVAEIVTQGPDEGMCCGTLKMRKTLGLQDGQLAEIASEELGTVSLDDLMGTQWTLHRLNFDQPPLADVTISADFADGTVSGTGGCNSYSAEVTSDGG
jgi:pimeloyl-ACP methyl ester carboxylesterase